MGTVVSLAGVATGFEPVPAGVYSVILSKAEEKTSKAGHPKVDCQLTIQTPDEHAGRKLFVTHSLQPQALFGFKRMVAAFDPENPILEDKKGFDAEAIAKSLVGQQTDVVVTVTEATAEFKAGNKVEFVLASEKGDGWGNP